MTTLQDKNEQSDDLPVDENTIQLDEKDGVSTDDGVFQDPTVSFDEFGLPKEILKELDNANMSCPSVIQGKGIPLILNNPQRNIIVQAHAGSGKTLCFVLTSLLRINIELKKPQVLVLSPTRELATQVMGVFQQFAAFSKKIDVFLAVPGCPENRITSQIIVGTPGTIISLLYYKHILDLGSLLMFILDEADLMVNKEGGGFYDQLNKIRNHSSLKNRIRESSYQTLLFSATYPEQVRGIITEEIACGAIRITIKRQQISLQNVKQFYINCENMNDKFRQIFRLFESFNFGESIIFANTTDAVSNLGKLLKQRNFNVSLLYGKMERDERDRVMKEFTEGKTTILVTTNVFARGIDAVHALTVIVFDIPVTRDEKVDPQTYVHRIHRVGRFGRAGIAISLVHDKNTKEKLQEIANYFARDILELSPNNLDECKRIIETYMKNPDVPDAPRIYGGEKSNPKTEFKVTGTTKPEQKRSDSKPSSSHKSSKQPHSLYEFSSLERKVVKDEKSTDKDLPNVEKLSLDETTASLLSATSFSDRFAANSAKLAISGVSWEDLEDSKKSSIDISSQKERNKGIDIRDQVQPSEEYTSRLENRRPYRGHSFRGDRGRMRRRSGRGRGHMKEVNKYSTPDNWKDDD